MLKIVSTRLSSANLLCRALKSDTEKELLVLSSAKWPNIRSNVRQGSGGHFKGAFSRSAIDSTELLGPGQMTEFRPDFSSWNCSDWSKSLSFENWPMRTISAT